MNYLTQKSEAGVFNQVWTWRSHALHRLGFVWAVCFAGVSLLLGANQPPAFTNPPLTRFALVGQALNFTASVAEPSGVTYQWRHNGQAIPGEISVSLSRSSAATGDSGFYEVIATNAFGSTSSFFQLRVVPDSLSLWLENTGSSAMTVVPTGLGKLVAASAGYFHNVVLRQDGTVRAWGSNTSGQIDVPVGLTGVVAIAAGDSHSMALKSDGTVVVWGGNDGNGNTVISPPAGVDHVVAIAAGSNSCLALKSDGTLVAWGIQAPALPPGLANCVAIASRWGRCIALKRDGTVAVWSTANSAVDTPPANLSGVVAVATGISHNVALKNDGTVVVWGFMGQGQAAIPAGLNQVAAISASSTNTTTLKANGSVVAWPHAVVPGFVQPVAALGEGMGDRGMLLVVAPLPAITAQPVAKTLNVGAVVHLDVQASGIVTHSYLWKRNGIALVNGGRISGADGPALKIIDAQLADSGFYSVEIANASGAVESTSVELRVVIPPPVVARPLNRSVEEGGSTTLTVQIGGAGPYTYVWRHNRQVVPDATGPSLALANLSLADAGYYEVTVTNAEGGISTRLVYMQVTIADAVATLLRPEPIPLVVPGGVRAIMHDGNNFLIKADGTVAAFDYYGVISNGTAPAGLADVVAVSARNSLALALKSDGTVTQWVTGYSPLTGPPAGLSDVVAIATGYEEGLALKADGTVVGWKGSVFPSKISLVPDELKNVVAIAAGYNFAAALKSDGTIVIWGGDEPFAPSPTNETGLIALAAGNYHLLGIHLDGSVKFFDALPTTGVSVAPPAGLAGVIAVASAGRSNVAVTSDGILSGWGGSFFEPLSTPPDLGGVVDAGFNPWGVTTLGRPIVPVITMSPQSVTSVVGDYLALRVQARAMLPVTYQWRRNGVALQDIEGITGTNRATLAFDPVRADNAGVYDVIITDAAGSITSSTATVTINVPPVFTQRPLSRLVAVGQPTTFSAAVTNPSGAVTLQWRHNGQDIAGETSSSLVLSSIGFSDGGIYEVVATNAVASSRSVCHLMLSPVAVDRTTVMTWGTGHGNASDAPSDLADVISVAASRSVEAALRIDGSVRGWSWSPVTPSGWSNVVAIAAGDTALLGLRADGTVVKTPEWLSDEPILPAGLRGIVAVAAAGRNNIALKYDGTVITWGEVSAPTGLSGVKAIAAGHRFGLALKTDGTVVQWGSMPQGATSLPSGLSQVVAIAARGVHALALKGDGTVVAWGLNPVGQVAVPSGLSGVVAISAGANQSAALKSDGTLVTWGLGGGFGPGPATPLLGLAAGDDFTVGIINGQAPVITVQPVARAGIVGGSFAFSVTATGTRLTYQWRKAGQDIPNQTGATLLIAYAFPYDFSQYDVVVSNAIGTAISSLVSLTLGDPARRPDFNGDGKADMLWRNTSSNDHAAWLMNGTTMVGSAPYSLPAEWRVIKVADFDGDGQSDLAWHNSMTGAVVLWQMNGTTIGTATWIYDSGTDWIVEIFADFNGDGKTDILWHDTVNGQYAIWLMNGGTVANASGFSIAAGWSVAKAADFNGDGKTDLLWRNASTGGVVMWLQNGIATTSSTWIYDSGTDWAFQLFADFNGDGKTDILWRNTVTGLYAFWLMDGSTVASASGFSIAAGWSVTNAADFNGDGKSDLIWRNSTSGGMVMWIQNGTTTTSTAWIYDSGTAWEIAATKDFNGDGKADILWRNTVNGQYAFWLMNGSITSSASGFSLPAGWEYAE